MKLSEALAHIGHVYDEKVSKSIDKQRYHNFCRVERKHTDDCDKHSQRKEPFLRRLTEREEVNEVFERDRERTRKYHY